MQDELQTRLARIEDRLAIYELLARHALTVDAAMRDAIEAIWDQEGSFDYGPLAAGPMSIPDMVDGLTGDEHRAAAEQGMAHLAALPSVTIDGDDATATSYLQLLVPRSGEDPLALPNHGRSTGYVAFRVSVSHWTLRRGPDGWRIRDRVMRAVGTSEARAIVAAAGSAMAAA